MTSLTSWWKWLIVCDANTRGPTNYKFKCMKNYQNMILIISDITQITAFYDSAKFRIGSIFFVKKSFNLCFIAVWNSLQCCKKLWTQSWDFVKILWNIFYEIWSEMQWILTVKFDSKGQLQWRVIRSPDLNPWFGQEFQTSLALCQKPNLHHLNHLIHLSKNWIVRKTWNVSLLKDR
jgi:hypothetical protein